MNNPINWGIYRYYLYIKFSLKNKVFFPVHHDYMAGPGGVKEKMLNFTKSPGQSPNLSSGRIGKINQFPCRLGAFVIFNR